MQFIITEVQFGWLIRSIHSWSANLMIATLFIHMFSVFFLRAYRPPREITWVSGVLLLFIVIWLWLQRLPAAVEQAGVFCHQGRHRDRRRHSDRRSAYARFLRGGDDVTGATLTRFFGFHVAVLPATATVFLAVHVLLVQMHGMSVPPSRQGPKR